MEETAKRRSYWDNIKGILILLVVFGHFLYSEQFIPEINFIVDIIYMFHMPAFVFVSGVLSRSAHSRSAGELLRLGVIYIIFNSVMALCGSGSINFIYPYYSMWYILALIVWRALADKAARIKHIMPMLFAAALLCGFTNIDNTFAISRIVCFSPYFMAGYMLDDIKIEKMISEKKPRNILTGLGALAAAVASYFVFDYSDDLLTMFSYEKYIDIFGRTALFLVAFLMIKALTSLIPDKNLPFITQIGRNSLTVFLCHRPLTLLYSKYIYSDEPLKTVGLAFAATLLIAVIFGSDTAAKIMNGFIGGVCDIPKKITQKRRRRVASAAVCCIIALCVLGRVGVQYFEIFKTQAEVEKILAANASADDKTESQTAEAKKASVIAEEHLAEFENAFRIVFTGDLILLEDQVRNGFDGEKYDYSDMFEYTEKYISSADIAIGVFEGPMGGSDIGYSTGNFDDGKELLLNYPDEFASAVKNAGFDLVTTANNHLLDKGRDAALRTLDVLDSIGLEHIGSYRSAEEKSQNNVVLIEQSGIKLAVLAYTYGTNNYTEEELLNGELSCITSVLVPPDDEYFEQVKESVRQDLDKAKSMDPDLIIVLPHMGTQFDDEPDNYQLTWCGIFKEYGADIILGDHTHSVQPSLLESTDGRKVFTAYCPGNYANIYREYNGDASIITEVYIDRDTKEIIGGGFIPMWTFSAADGNYRPVPVYDIMTDDALRGALSTYDIERVEKVQRHITSVVSGVEMGTDMAAERYYFDENGVMRLPAKQLTKDELPSDSPFMEKYTAADSVCFVGDSLTAGSNNGGVPWYEPLLSCAKGDVYNVSWGGSTVKELVTNKDKFSGVRAELFVIAVGTNDVRYRDEKICAMTAEEYIQYIKELQAVILAEAPQAEFIYIAPWTSADGDPFCDMSYDEKIGMNNEYSAALENYCTETGALYIDPNSYINKYITLYPQSRYLLDHIHPNYSEGVALYSEAVARYGTKDNDTI